MSTTHERTAIVCIYTIRQTEANNYRGRIIFRLVISFFTFFALSLHSPDLRLSYTTLVNTNKDVRDFFLSPHKRVESDFLRININLFKC